MTTGAEGTMPDVDVRCRYFDTCSGTVTLRLRDKVNPRTGTTFTDDIASPDVRLPSLAGRRGGMADGAPCGSRT